MSFQKYTHLFFDLDNTIWDFDSNSYEALYLALDKLHLLEMIAPYDTFYKIYSLENDKLWNLYRQGLMPKKVLRVQRFEASFERNGTPLKIGGGDVNDAYLLEMVNQTKLIEGAREVLDYLHGRYKIAIITNGFKEVQYDKIHKSMLSKYFSKVFISEEIGTPKPGKKIFEHALKSMNAPKKCTLMIGDSWEADILGAMNFGIDQIYFNPKMKKITPEGMFQLVSDHNNSKIQFGTPSSSGVESDHFHNKKLSTAFITHLEQLLIIL